MSIGLWIIIWMSALVIFSIAEVISNAFISIWFILSSLFLAIMNLIYYYGKATPMVWYGQILLFLILSTILLISFRPLVMKKFIKETVRTNADQNIGKIATVIKTIQRNEGGIVKIDGQEWSAFTESRIPLPIGSLVKVLEIRGVKVKVESVDDTKE